MQLGNGASPAPPQPRKQQEESAGTFWARGPSGRRDKLQGERTTAVRVARALRGAAILLRMSTETRALTPSVPSAWRTFPGGIYWPLQPKPPWASPRTGVGRRGTHLLPLQPPRDPEVQVSQQRIRASVFRYLFSFFPVSKFLPLRAVPLVKTGHPLRSPPPPTQ